VPDIADLKDQVNEPTLHFGKPRVENKGISRRIIGELLVASLTFNQRQIKPSFVSSWNTRPERQWARLQDNGTSTTTSKLTVTIFSTVLKSPQKASRHQPSPRSLMLRAISFREPEGVHTAWRFEAGHDEQK
jgi:hypothetical protein